MVNGCESRAPWVRCPRVCVCVYCRLAKTLTSELVSNSTAVRSAVIVIIMFNGLAWPIPSCLLVRNVSQHSSVAGFFNGSLDFTFYTFIIFNATFGAQMMMNSVRYHLPLTTSASFHFRCGEINGLFVHPIVQSLFSHPHSHKRALWMLFLFWSSKCVSHKRSSDNDHNCFCLLLIDIALFARKLHRMRLKLELNAQNHSK